MWGELAKKELPEQREFMRALLDALPHMIFAKDRDLRVTMVNRACCIKQGLPAEEILGKTAHELYPKEMADEFQAMDEAVLASGEPNLNEEWFESSDGRRLRMETHKIPYKSASGEVLGIVAVASDITDRHARDLERLQLLRSLQDTLRDLHDKQHQLEEANRKLELLSTTDALTEVYNRRALDERLRDEWNRCRRDGLWLAAILIDIDHFKAFNDHYGHQRGDECLQRVAQLLKDQLHRSTDFVARFGGEEFAILLPGADIEQAGTVAEACRACLHQLAIVHKGAPVTGLVTLSAGVAATIPDAAHDPEYLLRIADERLYLAKRTRNAVRVQ